MEQIIKFGISNYLQLCVEAGFSQIQSQITFNCIPVHGRFKGSDWGITTRLVAIPQW